MKLKEQFIYIVFISIVFNCSINAQIIEENSHTIEELNGHEVIDYYHDNDSNVYVCSVKENIYFLTNIGLDGSYFWQINTLINSAQKIFVDRASEEIRLHKKDETSDGEISKNEVYNFNGEFVDTLSYSFDNLQHIASNQYDFLLRQESNYFQTDYYEDGLKIGNWDNQSAHCVSTNDDIVAGSFKILDYEYIENDFFDIRTYCSKLYVPTNESDESYGLSRYSWDGELLNWTYWEGGFNTSISPKLFLSFSGYRYEIVSNSDFGLLEDDNIPNSGDQKWIELPNGDAREHFGEICEGIFLVGNEVYNFNNDETIYELNNPENKFLYKNPITEQGIIYGLINETIYVLSNDLCKTTSVLDEKNSELSIFPNPVKDILKVSFEKPISSYTIYDLVGNRLKASNTENMDDFDIELSILPAGMYYIQFEISDKIVNRKLVKS